MSANLNPDKALIFRIVHRDNLPWILEHGLHCRSSEVFDPNYRNIGNPDLISKRHHRTVPIPPGGTLSDYVPFYFTPFSIMLYNIKTGWGGLPQVPDEEIVILASSLHTLGERGIPFVFTNQHAYPVMAEYFSDPQRLDRIDWGILRNRDFKHDPEDPGKKERYQAEALVHRHLPVDALHGIGCYTEEVKAWLDSELRARGIKLQTIVRPGWYF
jgi:hypothetical protein